MTRCYMDSVQKVRKIMANCSVFVCRHCGLSYDKFLKANNCPCRKEKENATKI